MGLRSCLQGAPWCVGPEGAKAWQNLLRSAPPNALRESAFPTSVVNTAAGNQTRNKCSGRHAVGPPRHVAFVTQVGSTLVTYSTTWARARTPLARHQFDDRSGGRCPRVEYPKLRSVDVTERVSWRKKCQTKGVSKYGGLTRQLDRTLQSLTRDRGS